MGTKTIGIREDAYKRLKARKRADESFTELIERLLDEATVEWRDGFGTLEPAAMADLERAVEQSRERGSAGLAQRQQAALESFTESDPDTDETP